MKGPLRHGYGHVRRGGPQRHGRSSGGGGPSVDDFIITGGTFPGDFTDLGGGNYRLVLLDGGAPVSLDDDEFTRAELESGATLEARNPSWDGVAAAVTPGIHLVPAPGVPETEVEFTASGAVISRGTYTVPSLTPYVGEEVLFTETVAVVGQDDVTSQITIQPEAAFTPELTVPASAILDSPNNLGTNSDSFLMAIQGVAKSIGGTNQTLISLDSLNAVTINATGQMRVLTSDGAGGNASTAIYDAQLLANDDVFTFLFAFHKGSARMTMKKGGAAFLGDTNPTIANTTKRFALPVRMFANASGANFCRSHLYRVAVWTDIGSLIDVTTAAVQEKFVASDGTVLNPIRSQASFGKIGDPELRLDFYKPNFVTNKGAVSGFSLTSGTLT